MLNVEQKLEEKGFPGNNLLLLALKTYKLRPTFFFPSSSMRAPCNEDEDDDDDDEGNHGAGGSDEH